MVFIPELIGSLPALELSLRRGIFFGMGDISTVVALVLIWLPADPWAGFSPFVGNVVFEEILAVAEALSIDATDLTGLDC